MGTQVVLCNSLAPLAITFNLTVPDTIEGRNLMALSPFFF